MAMQTTIFHGGGGGGGVQYHIVFIRQVGTQLFRRSIIRSIIVIVRWKTRLFAFHFCG